ncbi:MAG: hypothetical protein C4521_07620 [Actinobacteria bacterium]|nr:MAG: hypothetical protein C4521_07620 [Actinomycetota bacterium]
MIEPLPDEWNGRKPRSGIRLIFTRKGLEWHGWYDTFVYIEGDAVSWDEIDRIRAELNARGMNGGKTACRNSANKK